MSMDWNDINFRGKDVIQLIVYAIALVITFMGISAKIDRYSDRMEFFQKAYENSEQERKDAIKSNNESYGGMQSRLYLLEQDVKLNKQEIENLKLKNK